MFRSSFSESTAREVMLQLFSAVQYIHDLRIVHRVSSFISMARKAGNAILIDLLRNSVLLNNPEIVKNKFLGKENHTFLAKDCITYRF